MLFSFKKRYEKNTRTFKMFNRAEITAALELNNVHPPQFNPQFFLPMVIHRSPKRVTISRYMETFCRVVLLTKFFGSPIIVKSLKK